MKLYITGFSSYRSDKDNIDIKKVLKQNYKYDTRRQDSFIHLAVYGAKLLEETTQIKEDDELYLTSGVGDVEVVQKTNTDIYKKNQMLRLFDFINLLGNTTSYYVARSIGIKGKNIFQISDNFTYINSLISAYASINNSQKNVILCGIDLVTSPTDSIKRVLGVEQSRESISSVNYQKLSFKPEGAIGSLEFDIKSYRLDEIKEVLKMQESEVFLSFRCSEELPYKREQKCFENAISNAVNEALRDEKNKILVDCYKDRYKILKVESLA